MRRAPVNAGEFRFRYPRYGGRHVRFGVGGSLLVVVFTVQQVDQGEPVDLTFALSLSWVFFPYFLYRFLCWLLPHVPDGQVVRVGVGGLQVGRRRLPAERLGREVIELEPAAASAQMRSAQTRMPVRCTIDGRTVRSFRFAYYPSRYTRPLAAVMIRDTEGGDRPWWLLAVPKKVDPVAFADALRSVAAGGWETPRG